MAETYTLSFHQGGDLARYGHNTRTNNQTGNPDIDPKKKHLNITLIDKGTTKDAYELLFQDAINKYNSKQKNKDRIIQNYHSKIKADPNKHLCYEIVIQIGSMKEGFPPNSKELLTKYVDDFQKKNPNLYVYGAFIHADEKGGIHLHLDYIPFYHCKRGLELKTSLTGALGEMGFKTYCKGDIVPDGIAYRFMTQDNKDYSSFLVNDDNKLTYNGKKKLTAQIQWEQAQRDNIRELCTQNNISLKKQGVGHKKYLTVREYKELQEELEAINSKISELKPMVSKLEATVSSIDSKKKLKQQDYDILTKTIKELQQKVNDLESEYQQKEQQLKQVDNQFDKAVKATYEQDKIFNGNREIINQKIIEAQQILDELSSKSEIDIMINQKTLDLMYDNDSDYVEYYQNIAKEQINQEFQLYNSDEIER